MLDWLKAILGDGYTEEIDKKVSAEIGKGFVSRADFNTKNEDLKAAHGQLEDANKTIGDFKAMDIDGIKKAADDWKQKFEQAEAANAEKLADVEFDAALNQAITEAKGRSPKAVKALLDVDTLKASKNQSADIKTALDTLKTESGYLFETGSATVDSGAEHGGFGNEDYSKLSDDEYYAATMKKGNDK